jgi:hypothetical protein
MFLSLDHEKVMRVYPYSIIKLKQWFKERSSASVSEVDDKVTRETVELYNKQLDEAIDDQYIQQVLQYGPRLLYDFFDDQNLFCSISYTHELNAWQQHVHPSPNVGAFANTRQEAESQVFESAFITLESRLYAAHTMTLKDVSDADLRSENNGERNQKGDNQLPENNPEAN